MSAHPIGVCVCKGTKKIAYAQVLYDFLFSGRPQAGYCLGFRESGHARRDTVERSGRIFTRRTSASAPHNASVIEDPAEN